MAIVVKNPPANAGDVRDMGSIPGLGGSPGGGHDNPLQCSCLENPMDRGAWWAIGPGVTKSRTQLKRLGTDTAHIVGLQCCVCFRCTVKRLSYTYIYIRTRTYIFFFRFFSIVVYYKILNIVSCAIQ